MRGGHQGREFMAARRHILAVEKAARSARTGPGPVRVAVLYPGQYNEGMASLSVHVLFDFFNQPPCTAERVFHFPSVKDVTRSLETASPLGDFDLILATVPFERQYFTLARMLEDGGVPVLAHERVEGDPVVMVGGPAPSANPVPLSAIADLVYVGEVEAQAKELRTALSQAWNKGGRRRDIVPELARVAGVVDCTVWGEDRSKGCVVRQWAQVDEYVPRSIIVSAQAELSGRALIEVGRGCPHGCKFCLARSLYHPVRPRALDGLATAMEEIAQVSDRIGLIGASFADHPAAIELLQYAIRLGLEPSVSSLRTDRVLGEPRLVEVLAKAGQRTLSLAPEAGSERLRRAIGKPLSDAEMLEAVRLLARAGIANLKLYFMIGLPGETDEEVQAIGQMLEYVRETEPEIDLRASVACFVPKPHTPFEKESMETMDTLRRRAKVLEKMSRSCGVQIQVESVRLAQAQAVLARGGPELSELIPVAAKHERPESALMALLESSGLDAEEYARYGSPSKAWQVVDMGCDKLRTRREK